MSARIAAGLMLAGGLALAAAQQDKPRARASHRVNQNLARRIGQELVTLPDYGVFDSLKYRIDGYSVTLLGEVTRPALKVSAEQTIRDIEGVERVTNEIRVLPVSPDDEALRVAAYRAIYGHSALNRYALQAVPPIHIVVENQKIALEGVVVNEGDKAIAKMQASSVPGVHSVTDNLKVEGQI